MYWFANAEVNIMHPLPTPPQKKPPVSLPIAATSIQPAFPCPQSGCCREVWLYLYGRLVFSPVHYFSPVFSVRCAQDSSLFFTEVLERALDKSNSKIVTRVLVTRSEVSQAGQKKKNRSAKHLQSRRILKCWRFCFHIHIFKEKLVGCLTICFHTDQVKCTVICRCFKDKRCECMILNIFSGVNR